MIPQRKTADGAALELLVIRSTRRPEFLTLRLAQGDYERSGEVMEALAPAGFLEGDRVTLELRKLGDASRPPGAPLAATLDLVVVRSTRDAARLSLRCVDDRGEVFPRLWSAGFRPGDRAVLRVLWRRAQR